MFSFFESRVDAFPSSQPGLPTTRFLKFLWDCTEGSRGWVMLLIGLTAAIGAFDALLVATLGRVVDLLGQVQPALLWQQHGVMLAVISAVVVASIGLIWLQTTVQHQVLAINFPMRLRWNFHRLLLAQSMSFYQDEFSGRITSRMMQTALGVRDLLFIFAEVIVGMFINFFTIVVFAAAFDIRLVWPFLIWSLAYAVACVYFVPRVAKVGREQADARSLMTGRVSDAYTNIATVKLFSHSRREAMFARDAMREFQGTGFRQMRLVSGFETVNHALSMLLVLGVAGCSLWLWSNGQVGVGAIAAATAMAMRLNSMAHWIMWQLSNLFENVGTVQDGIKTLSTPHAVLDRPGATTLTVPHGEVRFENLRFAYPAAPATAGSPPTTPRTIIDGLDLVVKPGEKIGLVGRSGSGKSTLVNLLLRFYELDSGRILVDGHDIAGVTQDSLRASIGMVTQDTSLLHRSVRDNIAYGRPDADEAAIAHAAERAEASGFIAQLSDAKGRLAYDAHVGERGVKLSGGQRQRIAIARVMLKDAPILLLDEATSALDSEVESAIQESLYRLMEGKTVIAIAHRLSTIAAMDRLVVLDGGRIAEQGDHRSLMEANGIYARLWAHQSGGFLGETDE
ncbi:ABC transporter ATP-binding protein [Xylophilus sp. GOD-11R]|uniref:ABC transporter ATP-binding protein n=1 Tax=Xylophilus sp. GOD-11R TaxID=3089814 RepID=UPI00298BFBAE|nr:ABC transporter ATP-binding protein [Xylophilus sp. GOD-11R]WPB59433.1 ABC transporter ATP-binding protein [Xylophilus sp. GOD-11R]